jgi:allene oxide cyclase-like protein
MPGRPRGRMLPGMNRILLIAAALVAAALIASPSQASHKDKVLALTGKMLANEQVDVGKPGPSLGDMNVITEDVYRNGKRVGTSDIQCTVVRIQPPKFEAQCFNTTSLPGGQITTQGIVTSDQLEKVPFDQAVTGGTGAYKGVSGQLTVDEAGDGPATFTFDLSR